MLKRHQLLQERLSKQRAIVGLLQAHPNTALAEMAGFCGYDFLILDVEHGLFDDLACLQTLQTVAATPAIAFVRLRGQDTAAVGRYLDMGADGIVAPNVETADQALSLVRAMAYPPTGTRGVGAPMHRGTRYGLDIGEHLRSPRQGASLIVMIESKRGVANVDAILAVEGVDGAFIGPFDLTADLGRAGEFSLSAYADAIARIEKAAFAQGKLLGTAPHPGYPIEALVARRHRMLLIGGDVSLIREAMMRQIAAARSHFEVP